jgi:hypothetical protein
VNETGTSKQVSAIDTAPSEIVHPDLSEIIGYEDVATAAAELIKEPHAFLDLLLELTEYRSLSDRILRSLVFYLLPRFKLRLLFDCRYLDKMYAHAMLGSSLVNETFELLPRKYQECFGEAAPFAGFLQFIAALDINCKDNHAARSILQLDASNADLYKQQLKSSVFRQALLLSLNDDPDVNEALGTRQMPNYEQLEPEKRTEALILELRDYFAQGDYYGINFQQFLVLEECIAYVKRFHRESWRVEVEDALEAWFFVNYCKKPRSQLNDNNKNILRFIDLQNLQGKLPSQRQIISRTRLANKTVNNAVGVKIKTEGEAGALIIQGYVEYDHVEKGYRLTVLGRTALTNDFYVRINGKLYRPKNPLEP